MNSEQTGRANSFADTEIFYRTMRPEGKVRGTVLISHGYAEYSGWHLPFMHRLADAGWASLAYDLRGHGDSEGLRGFILRIDHCVHDVETFVKRLKAEDPAAPVVLFGHSTGGTIAMLYAERNLAAIDGIITSAMYLKNAEPVSPALLAVAHVLDLLFPALPIKPFDAQFISRDPEIVAAYTSDPKMYNGNVRVRTGLELLANYKRVVEGASSVTVPALLLHGTGDRISQPATTSEVFERLGTARKQLRTYEGFYHDLLHDVGADEVLGDILTWLDEEFPASR